MGAQQVEKVEHLQLEHQRLLSYARECLAYRQVREAHPRRPAAVASHQLPPLVAKAGCAVDEAVESVLLSSHLHRRSAELHLRGVDGGTRDVDRVVTDRA